MHHDEVSTKYHLNSKPCSFMDLHFENLGNKIKIISNFNSVNCNLNKIIYEMTLTERESVVLDEQTSFWV